MASALYIMLPAGGGGGAVWRLGKSAPLGNDVMIAEAQLVCFLF